jgi:hypothetical protein
MRSLRLVIAFTLASTLTGCFFHLDAGGGFHRHYHYHEHHHYRHY